MSNEPKEQSLFHYMEKFSYLEELLEDGLWPRYCVEDFSWLVGHPAYISFPMKCFCDIPLEAAGVHRVRYGDYAVAISKDFARHYDINPIWYIQEGTSISKHLADLVADPLRVTLDTIPSLVKPLLPFLKSTEGSQHDRNSKIAGALEWIEFEEEMEWRYSPLTLIDSWKLGSRIESARQTDHSASLKHCRKLDFDHVEAVYVSTKAEVHALASKFPSLQSKVIAWTP